jgi:competence protein ComEC
MRTELERRPAVLLAVGWIVGLVAWEHPPAILVGFLAVALVRSWRLAALVAASFALGVIFAPKTAVPVTRREFADCAATVLTVPTIEPDRQTMQVMAGNRRFEMAAPRSLFLAKGDRIAVTGVVRPLSASAMRYLPRQGVEGKLEPVRLSTFEKGPWIFQASESVRRSFLVYTKRTFPPEIEAAVNALCVNVTSGITEEAKTDLRRTGTVHIVSASGLHVVVLASVILGILALLPIPRSAQIAILTAVLVVYACVAGLQGPIVRAAAVSVAGLSAYLFRRDPDPLSALAVTAMAYLAFQPSDVYDIGFQLSFVTVGAFALFLRPGADKGAVRSWLEASLVATVASGGLVAYYFGTLALLSIPANALLTAAVPLIVVSSLAGFALSFVWPPLGQGLALAALPMVGWVYAAVEYCGQPSWAVLEVPAFSAYWLLPFYGAFLLAWRRREVQAPA